MIYDIKLLEKYSVENLLIKLSKIRKIVLADRKKVSSEIAKRKKEIMESLNISTYM